MKERVYMMKEKVYMKEKDDLLLLREHMKEKDDLLLLREHMKEKDDLLLLRKQAQLKRLEDYVDQKLSDEDCMIRQLPEEHNRIIIRRKF